MAPSLDNKSHVFHTSSRRGIGTAILVALVILLAQFFLSSEVLAQEVHRLAPELSPRIELEQPPHWTVSAAWNGDQLVIVDALKSTLNVYAQDGSLIRVIKGLPGVGSFRPSYIQAIEGRLLLEYETAEFVWLRPDFSVESKFSLHGMVTEDGGTVESTFQWYAIDHDTLVTFSDVLKENGSWTSQFLWVVLEDGKVTSAKQVGQEVELGSPMRTLYVLGQPFLTGVNHMAVYMKVAQQEGENTIPLFATSIGKMGPTKQLAPLRLHELVLPGANALLSLPLDDRKDRRPGLLDIYNSLISLKEVVMGIYSSSDEIYVLGREITGSGPPEWRVEIIDPTSLSKRKVTLPGLEADYLVVVPGDAFWAIIEKGPVVRLGQQEVYGFRLISSDALD